MYIHSFGLLYYSQFATEQLCLHGDYFFLVTGTKGYV